MVEIGTEHDSNQSETQSTGSIATQIDDPQRKSENASKVETPIMLKDFTILANLVQFCHECLFQCPEEYFIFGTTSIKRSVKQE